MSVHSVMYSNTRSQLSPYDGQCNVGALMPVVVALQPNGVQTEDTVRQYLPHIWWWLS